MQNPSYMGEQLVVGLLGNELPAARVAAEESLCHAGIVRQPLHVTEALFLLASIEHEEGHRERALADILRPRDVLAEHRLEVRLPMLILAAAEWLLEASDSSALAGARRWLAVVSCREDVDATLRQKAHRLLARLGPGDAPPASAADASLSAVETEVKATLARLSPEAPHP